MKSYEVLRGLRGACLFVENATCTKKVFVKNAKYGSQPTPVQIKCDKMAYADAVSSGWISIHSVNWKRRYAQIF